MNCLTFLLLLLVIVTLVIHITNSEILIETDLNKNLIQDEQKQLRNSNPIIDKSAIIDIQVEPNLLNEQTEVESLTIRTATGGIVHRILLFLTIVTFIGNAIFMVHVFWLLK